MFGRLPTIGAAENLPKQAHSFIRMLFIKNCKNMRITSKLENLYENMENVRNPGNRIDFAVDEIDYTASNAQILKYIATKLVGEIAKNSPNRLPPEEFMPHLFRCIFRVSSIVK